MRPGTHAAGDGSFGRSAGMQVGRAVVLLAVAILIGVALLRHNSTSTGRIVSSTPTTAPSATGTSISPRTTAPPTTAPTSTTAPLRAPQDIKVLVANGTSTNGLASTVKSKLQAEGYQTLTSTNAPRATASVIYYRPGYQNEAKAMSQFLNLSPTSVQPMPAQAPVSDATAAAAANIIVVAGPDLASSGSTGGSGATTTTTRAHTTTTAGHTSTTAAH